MNLVAYIQLINTTGIGPITFYKLLKTLGNVETAIKNLPEKYKKDLFPKDKALKEIELAQKKGVKIIPFDSPEYPQKLKQIEDAPPVLYTLGDTSLLNHPLGISIVGARNASINGRKTASRIAFELSNYDILVISGMARGIDSAAHKGAMHGQNKKGKTVAVLGNGVDIVYPSENKELYEQIKSQGVIVSEFPLGTEPQPKNFPRRNRIVSALSDGILVVEATLNSGSLISSRLALEQGKEVFAIPGSPQDARSLGPNKLIKEGAILTESTQDILDAFPNYYQKLMVDKKPQLVARDTQENNSADTNLISLISPAGTHIDELIRESGLDSANISMALIELELQGKIERQPGNFFALIK